MSSGILKSKSKKSGNNEMKYVNLNFEIFGKVQKVYFRKYTEVIVQSAIVHFQNIYDKNYRC